MGELRESLGLSGVGELGREITGGVAWWVSSEDSLSGILSRPLVVGGTRLGCSDIIDCWDSESGGKTQEDNEGSRDRLKLWKVDGGGLLSMLSTSSLHASGSTGGW